MLSHLEYNYSISIYIKPVLYYVSFVFTLWYLIVEVGQRISRGSEYFSTLSFNGGCQNKMTLQEHLKNLLQLRIGARRVLS